MSVLALNACIALLPVLLFLAALVLMDTFKLAHWTTIVEGMPPARRMRTHRGGSSKATAP